MSELAPGIFVTDYIPRGTAYVMRLQHFIPDGPERGIALNPLDWEILPGAERERILDDVMRRDADRGLRRLQAWLARK